VVPEKGRVQKGEKGMLRLAKKNALQTIAQAARPFPLAPRQKMPWGGSEKKA